MRASRAALIQAVGLKRIEPGEALHLLLERASLETDPAAYQATLQSLLELLQGLGPDAVDVVTFRQALVGVDANQQPQLLDSRVDALARMPWSEEPGPHDYRAGLEACAALIGELAGSKGAIDFDQLSLALASLRHLAAQSSLDNQEVAAVTARVAAPVQRLLRLDAAPLEARLDAVAVLPLIARGNTLNILLDELETATSEQVRFALLGPVEERLDGSEIGDAETDRLLSVLVTFVASPDDDLRRRALELLATDPLVARLPNKPKGNALANTLLAGLVDEGQPAMQLRRLEVLAELGPDLSLAHRLIENPNFDTLLDGNHRRPEQVVKTLIALTSGSPERAMRVARRLADDPRESPPEDALDEGQRAAAALTVLESLEPIAAARLGTNDDAQILEWYCRVRAADGDRAGGPDAFVDYLPRLITIHLEKVSTLPDSSAESSLDLARARALLLGDAHVSAVGDVDLDSVLRAYEDWLALATRESPERSAQRSAEAVLNRARFKWAVGLRADSLKDYRFLLLDLSGALREDVARELSPSDLRHTYEGLIVDDELAAIDVACALVSHPEWGLLATEVRLDDVKSLLGAAELAANPAYGARVLELFASVPNPREGAPDEKALEGTVVERLLDTPEVHESIWESLDKLRSKSGEPSELPVEETGGDPEGGGNDGGER